MFIWWEGNPPEPFNGQAETIYCPPVELLLWWGRRRNGHLEQKGSLSRLSSAPNYLSIGDVFAASSRPFPLLSLARKSIWTISCKIQRHSSSPNRASSSINYVGVYWVSFGLFDSCFRDRGTLFVCVELRILKSCFVYLNLKLFRKSFRFQLKNVTNRLSIQVSISKQSLFNSIDLAYSPNTGEIYHKSCVL